MQFFHNTTDLCFAPGSVEGHHWIELFWMTDGTKTLLTLHFDTEERALLAAVDLKAGGVFEGEGRHGSVTLSEHSVRKVTVGEGATGSTHIKLMFENLSGQTYCLHN